MTDDANRPRCAACRFWERSEKGQLTDWERTPPVVSDELPEDDPAFVGVGECKRYPPTLSDAKLRECVDTIQQAHKIRLTFDRIWPRMSASSFPVTWEDDWCGEWQPRRGDAP